MALRALRFRKIALLLVLLALVLLVASSAVGAPNRRSATATAPYSIQTTTPPGKNAVDLVTWDLARGGPRSLDPLLAFGSQNTPVVDNLCDTLLHTNPDGTIASGLATKWVQKNAKTWVFTIRKGVRFWNGTPLTARDVAFSLNRSATTPTSQWTGLLSVMSSATASGSTVTVKLKQPSAIFPEIVAGGPGAVVSEAYVRQKGKDFGTPAGGVMCSGPFKLVSWTPGVDVKIAANKSYWDKTHIPKVSVLDFKFITDQAALTNALNTGAIDGTYFVPVTSLNTLKDSSEGSLHIGPPNTAGVLLLFWNDPSKSLLANVKVRQALRYAIDYVGIRHGVFLGAAVGLRATAPPSDWTYAKSVFSKAWKSLPPAQQDLAKAKNLLQGIDVSKPITCAAPASTPEFIATCEAVQSGASQVGLTVRIKLIPNSQYAATSFKTNPSARVGLDMNVAQVPFYITDPLNMYQTEAAPNGQFNLFGYNNPKVTSWLSQAEKTANPNARAALVVKAQKQIMNDLPWIPLYGADQTLFMNKRITGAALPIAQYYPWAIALGSSS